ncbi:MAG: ribosomal RNA small subunit methyltransferase A [Deltaproteobacteria bacterium]|nr:ribosomal RNA small subunit methyltransferase A [Deltaproteobacteria bacterium]
MSNIEKTFENPVAVLKRYGLYAKKSWGQNFLVSEKAINKITQECQFNSLPVLEIGAGLGTLTSSLLNAGIIVTAIERDEDMCTVLKNEFENISNFTLLETDAGQFNYSDYLKVTPSIIAGNLPYQITGKILRQIMDTYQSVNKAVFMVQKEAADRICAQKGDTNRGALSVITQARFSARIVHRLKPTAFHPPPKVHSAVITFLPVNKEFLPFEQMPTFDKIVKAAFLNRRKNIKNSLKNSGIIKGDNPDELLAIASISQTTRAQDLSIEEFVKLTSKAIEMNILNVSTL